LKLKIKGWSLEKIKTKYKAIQKNKGATSAERYLGVLCKRTFLSLWSYQNIYRNEKDSNEKTQGKEIADLLVIFGEHILIFSDKYCAIPDTGDIYLDWSRWFDRAIKRSTLQAWGAERWIRHNPSRLFLDKNCKQPIPLKLPKIEEAYFHLIVVAHGINGRIADSFGGSGSLMIDSSIEGFENHIKPFNIGVLDSKKTFVHVFDTEALNCLMYARDTISDFVAYLMKREKLLSGSIKISSAGEEELLAVYMTCYNEKKEHDFIFPVKEVEKFNGIALVEGHWKDFEISPQRIEQLKQDEISYMWDALIEKFNHYALLGKQYAVTEGGFKDTEAVLRFMAREPRFKRRLLSNTLKEILETTPDDMRRLRILPPLLADDPYYIFLLLPYNKSFHLSNHEYREARMEFLKACCMVLKMEHPTAKDIVGIATESGLSDANRSEDAVHLDAREWNVDLDNEARKIQKELNILTNAKPQEFRLKEYPDILPNI
jgi:hypothetical protein